MQSLEGCAQFDVISDLEAVTNLRRLLPFFLLVSSRTDCTLGLGGETVIALPVIPSASLSVVLLAILTGERAERDNVGNKHCRTLAVKS